MEGPELCFVPLPAVFPCSPVKRWGGFGTNPVPGFQSSVTVLGDAAGQQGSPRRGTVSSGEQLGHLLGVSSVCSQDGKFPCAVCDGGWGDRGWSHRHGGKPVPHAPAGDGLVLAVRPGLASVGGKWAGSTRPLGVGRSPAAWPGAGFSPGRDEEDVEVPVRPVESREGKPPINGC